MRFKGIHQLAVCILALGHIHSSAASAANLNICYLSLNQESEREELVRILGAEARQAGGSAPAAPRVDVNEYFHYGDRAHEAFRTLINAGERCDGLVLSGHHRAGGFEGSRAVGRLAIENLERWSCDPRFRNWFAQVKALWLQGCATSNRGVDDRSELSHRYARIFPHATIFAWSGSAPSRMGAVTIPLQLKNFGKLQASSEAWTAEQALAALLRGEQAERAASAWEALQLGKRDKLEGIANRTARAFLPLASTDAADAEANHCVLENSSDAASRIAAVKYYLRSPNASDWQKIQREWERAAEYPMYRAALADLLRSNLDEATQPRHILAKGLPVTTIVLRYRLYLGAGGRALPHWESTLQSALLRELGRRQRGFDEVERKHHYGRLAEASLAPLPNGQVLLGAAALRSLKNKDALLALVRAMIEFRSPQQVPHLFALAENRALPLEAVPILESLVQTSDSSTKKIYLQKKLGAAAKFNLSQNNLR